MVVLFNFTGIANGYMRQFTLLFGFVIFTLMCLEGIGQGKISGTVYDQDSGEPVIYCNVILKGSVTGVTTDFDGKFEIDVNELPAVLQFSFISYLSQEEEFTSYSKGVSIRLSQDTELLNEAEVVGERISEKQKQAPLTMESMDVQAIKDAASGSFYESLGTLKEVDVTSASLGFKIINTRGFNSTSPVRSLQLIDGVDNQSPGLNFSLGNFLGSSDLDVMKVDIIAGASSAFYGPGAFNGVVQMTTKDPFIFPGFSMYLKKGERGLFEQAIRYAQVIQNKDGEDKFAYKINWFRFQANEWEATNFEPIYGSPDGESNPYGFDAVNIYGDEPIAINNDVSDAQFDYTGLGTFYRNGYREEDLVNYNTDNLKFNSGLYYKFNPQVVLNYNFNYSTGNTIYQGENRYALKDIEFFQHKLEVGEKDKWFVRAYSTSEDAGNTYDIVTTAVRMLDESSSTADWNTRFVQNWGQNFTSEVQEHPTYNEIFETVSNSGLSGDEQLALFNSLLAEWYLNDYDYFNSLYQQNVDQVNEVDAQFIEPFYQPGTERYDSLFRAITSSEFTEGGSRFYDKSKLYHLHGEYKMDLVWADLVVGANARWYRPDSHGTIFKDTLQYTYQLDSVGNYVLGANGHRLVTDSVRLRIQNQEWGAYLGLERWFAEDRLKANVTTRVDKNVNFDYLISPAASLVYVPNEKTTLRLSFSSAIRNPTLADQYLYYNVGRAILLGNIDGRFEAGQDSLFTIDSFNEYRSSSSLVTGLDKLEYFNVDKIRPEKVKTIEGGFRGTLWENTYLDAAAYYSVYTDFIGYNIGLNTSFDQENGFPNEGIQVFRVAANAREKVTTTGFSIGFNYYFKHSSLNGNYSFNKLVSDNDDPIIPAFNTPEHKFNLGFSGRDIKLSNKLKHFGYGVNYKWIDGFLFEGSPQFTGNVSSYDMIDVQVNLMIPEINCTFKVGSSNLLGIQPLLKSDLGNFGDRLERALNNENIQVYGGPRVGRLMYASILFELK